MRRVSVVGGSGSGKTTTARRLAERLGVAHVELDAIYHLPSWTPRPREEMRSILAEMLDGDGWVVDGNYRDLVQDLVWAAADTVVWLDLPRWTATRRVIGRSLWRTLRRRELWNGNRERATSYFRRDPEENIILWAWTQHARYRAEYERALASPQWRHLDVARLRSRREVDAWLNGVA